MLDFSPLKGVISKIFTAPKYKIIMVWVGRGFIRFSTDDSTITSASAKNSGFYDWLSQPILDQTHWQIVLSAGHCQTLQLQRTKNLVVKPNIPKHCHCFSFLHLEMTLTWCYCCMPAQINHHNLPLLGKHRGQNEWGGGTQDENKFCHCCCSSPSFPIEFNEVPALPYAPLTEKLACGKAPVTGLPVWL